MLKGGEPPVMTTVAVPSQLPLHNVLVAEALKLKTLGSVTFTEAGVNVHP
jgi:hypothetical protein